MTIPARPDEVNSELQTHSKLPSKLVQMPFLRRKYARYDCLIHLKLKQLEIKNVPANPWIFAALVDVCSSESTWNQVVFIRALTSKAAWGVDALRQSLAPTRPTTTKLSTELAH